MNVTANPIARPIISSGQTQVAKGAPEQQAAQEQFIKSQPDESPSPKFVVAQTKTESTSCLDNVAEAANLIACGAATAKTVAAFVPAIIGAALLGATAECVYNAFQAITSDNQNF